MAGIELLFVGLASIAAGVLYTGGPRPYGYAGLGEVFVFLFFGVVAVTGSYFVQTEEISWLALALSVPIGLLAAAILVVNNVRDIDTDRRAGKRTLAVKLGRERAAVLFTAMLVVAFLAPVAIAAAGWLSPFILIPAVLSAARVARERRGAHPARRAGTQRSPGHHRCAPGRLRGASDRRDPALVKRALLRLSIPFRHPLVTAFGEFETRELLLHAPDGGRRNGGLRRGRSASRVRPFDHRGVHRCAPVRRSAADRLRPPPAGSWPRRTWRGARQAPLPWRVRRAPSR